MTPSQFRRSPGVWTAAAVWLSACLVAVSAHAQSSINFFPETSPGAASNARILVSPSASSSENQAQSPPSAGEVLPLPPVLDETDDQAKVPALRLEEVRYSVSRFYPLLAAAVQQRDFAAGEQLSTRGAYDVQLKAENMTGALGFYQTNRAALKAEQYTLPGGKVWSGYRIGRGSFEPWYLERQTNEGGEFKIGYQQSLLQGLSIDKRRAAMRKADLSLAAAEPSIDKQRIYFLKYAALDYWKWVAAGHWYIVNRDLLHLAEERVEGIENRIRRGSLPEIESVDNRRLVVSRQTKLIDADRKFQQAAVELSLYLRNDLGAPLMPTADRLPSFPPPVAPDENRFEADVDLALAYRPEPRYLRLQREKAAVELRYARNLTLPQLDAVVDGSKDVGAPTSSKNDKGPFQLEAGLVFDVPAQRRFASGQIRAAEAVLAQIRAEEQFAVDRVRADVQFAFAGLKTAFEEYAYAVENVELAQRMEDAELSKFNLGNSNILLVNIREQATADARILMIDALAEYHLAEAEYRAALGLDAGFSEAR